MPARARSSLEGGETTVLFGALRVGPERADLDVDDEVRERASRLGGYG